MNTLVTRWYNFTPFIAGTAALVLGLGHDHWSMQQVGLLLAFIFIQLHFFEEFGMPGGFAWGGLKVEGHKLDKDVSEWPLNQANSLWGNQWFAVAVYLLPLVTGWNWAVLAAFAFAFLEAIMHFVVFNIGLKTWYNAGSFTTVLLVITSVWFLADAVPDGQFSWLELVIALVWCGFNYWMAFLSPISKKLASLKQYAFSREDVMKSRPWMKKFPGADEGWYGFRDEVDTRS